MSAQVGNPPPYIIDQIRCPECNVTCLQKNIYRHMAGKHTWSKEDCKVLINAIQTEKRSRESQASFVCTYCSIMFKTIRHLVRHKRICEQPAMSGDDPDDDVFDEYMGEEIEEEEIEYIEDDKPSTSGIYQSAIPPHRQTARPIPQHHLPAEKLAPMHPGEKLIKPPSLGRHRGTQTKCPECPVIVESIEELLAHCREKHESEDRKFFAERHLFDSRDEFKKWFDQRQEDTCTSLTKRTGHGGETFYRCHRIGKYQSVAKARKSNPRKIDQTCTAYLKVFTQEDGSTWANGCFTHIGHELDHKLLWLTETQENYVRELIDLSWNSDQIFFYIREEYKNYECKLKHISKNDIRNITVRYNREKAKQAEAARPRPFYTVESRLIRDRELQKIEKTDQKSLQNGQIQVKTTVVPEKQETEGFRNLQSMTCHDAEEPPNKIPRTASPGEESPQQEIPEVLETSEVPPEVSEDVEVQTSEAEPSEASEASNAPETAAETSESQQPLQEEENEYINVVDDEPGLDLEVFEEVEI